MSDFINFLAYFFAPIASQCTCTCRRGPDNYQAANKPSDTYGANPKQTLRLRHLQRPQRAANDFPCKLSTFSELNFLTLRSRSNATRFLHLQR